MITDGVFVVTTTADSGPGSLRQAILDANTAAGATQHDRLRHPGPWAADDRPRLASATDHNPVLIDGFSQPGYAGSPLIQLTSLSGPAPDALTITGSDLTLRGVTTNGFDFGAGSTAAVVAVQSGQLQPGSSGAVNDFWIDTTAGALLNALVDPQGLTTGLSLLDSQGQMLVQSDGVSPGDPDDAIAEHLPAGTYYLMVVTSGRAGSFSLTITLTPASAPYQLVPASSELPLAMGDFTGNGITDIATPEGIFLGTGDGTFETSSVGLPLLNPNDNYTAIVAADFNGDGKLDLALVDAETDTVDVLLGNGDGTFQAPQEYPVGSGPESLVVGDFSGDGSLDLAVTNTNDNDVSILMGNGNGTFMPADNLPAGIGPTALVAGDFSDDGKLDLAAADAGTNSVIILLGNGNGTFQSPISTMLPNLSFYGNGPGFEGPESLAAGDFTGNGKLDLAIVDTAVDTGLSIASGGVFVLLGNGDGTFQPPNEYAAGYLPEAVVAGDFNGDGHLDLASPAVTAASRS